MDLIRRVVAHSRTRFPSKDFTFSMTTNFFNADDHIEYLADNGFFINLSLDGPQEVHDKNRRTKGGEPTHEKILSNLRRMEEYFPGYVDSHVFVLATCKDPIDLPKIVHFFEESPYFVSHVNGVDPKGRISSEENTRGNTENLIREFRRRILQGEDPRVLRRLFDQDLKAMAMRDERVMPSELMLNGSCYPGRRRIFVDVGGDYHPCERFGPRAVMGSVEKGFQDDRPMQLIESFATIRNSLCGECWAQRVCTPCIQHAKDLEGEISVEGLAQTCETRKRQLLMGLGNYVTLVESDRPRTEDYVQGINPLFERG